jgi:hypothetical protein
MNSEGGVVEATTVNRNLHASLIPSLHVLVYFKPHALQLLQSASAAFRSGAPEAQIAPV